MSFLASVLEKRMAEAEAPEGGGGEGEKSPGDLRELYGNGITTGTTSNCKN